MHCLDPGEVYAVALDLLLPALGRELGLALFRRSEMPGSDGIAFRGFDEVAATELQRRVAQAKADSALFAPREPCTTRGGPIGEALDELGVGGGPRAARAAARRREGGRRCSGCPSRAARPPRPTSSRRA